ncbi:SDR family NAD(P)-dependent oxidoreductase [Streptomyces sp. MNP-20]|uniref:SDR family NAD(P)-dependent oxidoreductase n=1 Tax=Streptomyces sp. MNP-20 TaxID=2721165 RepID=UPI0015537B0A|nr:SDR family NAD(P)-dependent oxidoreductase [Streptomyces sp. MNP-20]
MPRLLELEELCWAEPLRVSAEVIRRRLFSYPVGQFVVESDGAVHAVIYSQRIGSPDDVFAATFDTADRLHRPDGPVAQVLSLNVDPSKQSFRFGDLLLEHLLTCAEEETSIGTAVGVTRFRDFGRHPEPDLAAYLRATNAQGRCLDTVLRMHQLHGAEIRALVPGYRPGDLVNEGNGVLVVYDLSDRQERVRILQSEGEKSATAPIPPRGQLAVEIREFFDVILGVDYEGIEHPLESPLFELGFDSAGLLDLQEKIESRYGIALAPLFFFEHNTGALIISYLEDLGEGETGHTPDASPSAAAARPAGADTSRDVAVIGTACRLPGGIEDRAGLWELLTSGTSAIGTLPEGRWQWPDGTGPDTHPGIDRGGFVTDAGGFEAALFRVTPYEARHMDPQQRWTLELAWACLEDAGYAPSGVAGTRTGVFVGASGSDYQRVMDTRGLPVRAHSGLATSMAVIANRVSYFFDLRGPSVQLDTACSSSLVAVHTALRALRAGECDTALVAGVNVLAHPANSVAYHQAGMLSPDGQCKTFDASANGYVRSEGGVALLLKPLAAALADGDPVHAVIKGSATNHGGQAGGLTVPSAALQASLVEAALADAGLGARDIGYVEAHGTGTALGDPIEVQGLTKAFADSDAPCALGSVKTNLGHLEAAAGITGLLKTVLALQHRQLPASLHYERPNPHIDLDASPFSVVTRLSDWELDGRPLRRAGISSFGSGGSNAHVVVEEFPHAGAAPDTSHGQGGAQEPAMVVLSARSTPQLLRQARRLLDHLRQERPADTALRDIAYTTQVGRAELPERLGLAVTSVASLGALLEDFVADADAAPAVLRGRAERDAAPAAPGAAAEDVLAAWVRGARVDWEACHAGGARPRRVPLPTHAFDRDHYWLADEPADDRPRGAADRPAAPAASATDPSAAPRHPLLQRAIQDADALASFASVFSAEDLFLRDHRVAGDPVLPGVASLEMAREAASRTLPAADSTDSGPAGAVEVLRLENVVWSRPVVVREGTRTVRTVVTAGAHSPAPGEGPAAVDAPAPAPGPVAFEIRAADVVHARGVASRIRTAPPEPLDLDALKTRTGAPTLDIDDFYATLRATGLDYGATHRAVSELRLGDGEILAALTVPAEAADTLDACVLHPSVLDGALQAAFAPDTHAAGRSGLALPFALDRIDVHGPTPRSAYAWVRAVPTASRQVRRWDLDLCDPQGRIFARLRGYSMRKTTEPAAEPGATHDVTLFRPVWRAADIQDRPEAPAHTARLVLACGFDDRLGELRALAPEVTFLEPPEQASGRPVADSVAEHAVELLRAIRGLLIGRPAGSVLLQVLAHAEGEQALHQALSGLLRTARLENPALLGQVIAVPADATAADLAEALDAERRHPGDQRIHRGDGTREVLAWEPLDETAATGASPVPWRPGGVYLITGGAGGLGRIFARDIARRAPGAVLCLTGRSPLGPAVEAELAALRTEGARPEYHVLDVTDGRATERLVRKLTRRHKALHGVLHAAGVLHDAFLQRKTDAEFRRVLAPKLAGCRAVDEATKGLDLDFFALFSSVMGTTGNVGQGDYAVANAFLDAFAHHRGARVATGGRKGRTLSVAWPLWHGGGMGADEDTRRALRLRGGFLPMATDAGVDAFHRALDSAEPHVVVWAGDRAAGERALLDAAPAPQAAPAAADAGRPVPASTPGSMPASEPVPAPDERALRARTVEFLKAELCRLTQLPPDELDDAEPLGSYGMDSILATELTAGLEKTFGSLPKTLLFEYHTLAELGGYFADAHRTVLEAMFADAPEADTSAQPERRADAVARAAVAQEAPGPEARHAAPAVEDSALDIAVIGLSGRYPEARDVREFWENLRAGRDCVVEVPEDRWDWREYYEQDRTVPGRHYSKWGGFISEVDRFDPLFFNIAPHEADYLDPQERLFLEHAWTAMEDAGYTRERLGRATGDGAAGRVGVYAGVMWGQYQLLFPDGGAGRGNPHALGSSYASVANRVSFVLNVHGPSMTVDTMCSSSLTAVELACRDLRRGRTGLAFAGGVNVTVHPNKYLGLSTGQFISSQGHCESFGVGGDGYIPGEGVGVVLLKPLRDAERDGDHVYGVIKGSGVSHGGRTNGYTVPNPRAQQAAIQDALSESGVDPRAISYVEAHGTGTKLGDPIEITGLSQAFTAATPDGAGATARCHLGSAKSNIGHCESAAGIAGLTKVLLQLQHRQIAPSLHSATLNPHIDFSRTPFVVNQELRDWERPVVDGCPQPRIAGVSSFGAGGANAHLIVAEHTDRRPAPAAHGPQLFPLSAKDDERLRAYAERLLRFAKDTAELANVTPADLAYTLQTGREAMDERLGVVADSFAALAEKLERHLAGDTAVEGVCRGNAKRDRKALAIVPAEELAETVASLARRGKAAELLELWARGAAPDWQALHAAAAVAPRRISAPTYPFARDRHWVPEAAPVSPAPVSPSAAAGETSAAPASAAASSGSAPAAELFLTKQWRPAPSAPGSSGPSGALVLHGPATRRLAERIAELLDGAVLVDATDPGADGLVDRRAAACAALIDLTGTGDDSAPAGGVDRIAEDSPSGRALALLRRVLDAKASRDIRLLFVTQGLESADAAERGEPRRVPLTGAARAALYRLLQSEYRSLTSRHVDLDPAVRDLAALAAVVHRELLDEGRAPEVCHRDGARLAPVLAPSPAPAGSRRTSPAFAPDEVLLVTGGTRGIGLLCARHFVARHGVRRLVLTGREPLPPRHLWTDPQACPPAVRAKTDAVAALEAQGVEVRVLALPLDDADAVAAAVATVESTLGPIAGVLHAAGLVDTSNPAFVRKPVADVARVVSPKIDGTVNLLAALDPRALRFAVLFSSVSAALPTLGAGQSDYAMGNAFMDYFAHARAHELPVTSVQWPSWRETGFGEVTNKAYTDTGLLSITNAEGLAFLDEILTAPRGPVVMPVRVDAARFDAAALLDARPAAPAAPAPRARTVEVQQDSAANESLGARLTAFLSDTFSGELGLKSGQLDTDTSYADYGADSILLAQILQRIRQRLDVPLDPSVLLEYPTLSELVTWLLDTYPTEVAARFGAEPVRPGPTPSAAVPAPAEARATNEDTDRAGDRRVAVVGMACRLPGAPGLDAYWELLSEGRRAVREVPAERWGRPTGFRAGLIDDVYAFDAGHFMLHDEDVRAMDPQALVLLEESLKAVHHAGYRAADLEGSRTGVYVGARSGQRPDGTLVDGARNPIMTVGQNYLAANVSQFFDWHGPAMVMDTACSSALTAMKVATDALAAGSVDLALVAGVSLLADPEAHELFRRRGLLREDGAFHIFDRRAGGVVLGEGAGVVLLKPLAAAERDGDTVYAVVEGLAVNNDGRTAGPATPNLTAQKQVMREALRQAGCPPHQVGHLDVNGSGSELTDLLELKAVQEVYGVDRTAPLHVGSMKPNIGHPLCAEGIAAFIKVALMVHHQRTVPFLSGEQPMEHFTIDPAVLRLPRRAEPVDLAYAAVSSFADGGTNGHVILGRPAAPRPGEKRRRPLALPELDRRDVRTGASVAEARVWTRRVDAQDAVVDGHRVYGRRLLPGLAWIDLLYGCCAELTPDASPARLVLRDLSIYRPLAVDEGAAVDLRVEARATAADAWRITVTDAARGEGEAPAPYVTADVHLTDVPTAFDAEFPADVLDALRAPGEDVRDLGEIYRSFRSQELVHSGAMKAVGSVRTTPDDIWVSVAVDEGFLSHDWIERSFQPVLIDGSAVAASAVALGGEPRLFLPLHYASFRATGPLGRACHTRVRRDTITRGDELLTFGMEFFDDHGRKLAELTGLTTKAVRDAGHIAPARKAAPAPVADAMQALVRSVVADRLGVPAERVDAGASYYALGLDSATLLRVAAELGERLGTRLAPTLLFEHATVAALAGYLARHHQSAEPVKAAEIAEAVEAVEPGELVEPSAAPEAPAASAPAPVPAVPDRSGTRDIAIVGIGGRYPKARGLAEFWENLKSGRDCVGEVPEDRWPRDTFGGERTPSGRPVSHLGGFLDDPDCFDAEFFQISDAEAARLDPQERLFLEVCWEAVEDAGYTPAGLSGAEDGGRRGTVGVFAGVMHKDYVLVQHDAADGDPAGPPLALNAAAVANRVSHVCDFRGPSLAVDSVCASSLNAVHLAVESLRRGECDAALAGGVNLSLHPAKYGTYGGLDLLAGDAPARSFGAGGDGYVAAEGVGAVLLKPLERALADGDAVYAVIKGTAVNHSGRTPGMRVPSVAAQAELIETCLERAGVDAGTIGYLEAHGTGTEIGDLIEVQGLRRAFEKHTGAKGFCALGSVKSAIGHAEAAAGISGLTKAVLQLHHRTLTPLVGAAAPNPYLDLADSPFRLQTDLEEWTVDAGGPGTPRRAGVSAFGATGTNAHVVVEEAPPVPDQALSGTVTGPVLVPLSATDGDRLRAYAEKLLRFLDTKEGAALAPAALAHTLQTGRVALAERAVILAHDLDEVREGLEAVAGGTGTDGTGVQVWRGRVAETTAESRLLDEDDVRAELVGRWAAQGKWGKVAELWLGGHAVAWPAPHGAAAPRRVHLPTYPFAKRRHWVTTAVPAARTVSAKTAVSATTALSATTAVPAATITPTVAAPATAAPVTDAVRWCFIPDGAEPPVSVHRAEPPVEEKARGYLRQLVAARVGRPAQDIGPHAGLIELGLTSLGAVGLSKDLAATVAPGFVPSALFEYGTVAELAGHLADRWPAGLKRLVATRPKAPGVPEPQEIPEVPETPDPDRPSAGPEPRPTAPDVLDVLECLRAGALHLDDAIALLDEESYEK